MKPTVERPAESAGELYRRTDISPDQFFQALGRLRKEAQDEIERLLAFLDSTEPDPDLEPSLGSLGEHHTDQTRWAAGDRRELEQDPAESGIGDLDGLLEQVGSQDWQQGAMA
ncbi:hypothetical protein [Bradyrhizobium sp. 150]|uniref:hypothetical protein n=1 Tax=Bradyrhizobium sp. 150 TaxID=2782625 RepID=UPI001FF9A652|nr:hypothetical protein [Bradyrhizobium sp. 150]MCK1671231.1 hypothetical protein [Bradyrhizobium sp. 150]